MSFYNYFISYSYLDKNGNSKFGNGDMTLSQKIDSIDIIVELQKNIAQRINSDGVIIIKYELLKRG